MIRVHLEAPPWDSPRFQVLSSKMKKKVAPIVTPHSVRYISTDVAESERRLLYF